MTDESFSIFLSMVETQHAANQAKRSTLTRATLEEKAEVAAVACALSVELAGALAEKSESYTVRDNASPQVCA